MFRIWLFCLGVSTAILLGGCKSQRAAAPSRSVAGSRGDQAPPRRARWESAELVAGNRANLSPGAPAPEETLWRGEFEGKDARDAKLTLPYMAVQDSAGRVYIADKLAHSVRWVDEIQNIHTAVGTGREGDGANEPQAGTSCDLSLPNALWVHPSGRLYLLDFGNAKLRRWSPQGQIETLFELPKDIQGGRGLAVSADESTVYVAAKDRIYRFNAQGGPKVFAQGFENLGHLALSQANELYAADRDAGYVYRVDASGQKHILAGDGTMRARSGLVPATQQGLNQPRALAWVPKLGLLIGTQGGRRVYRLTKEGQLELLLDGLDPSKKIASPLALQIQASLGKLRGLSVSPNGDLLLTHGDLGQVLRFKKNGPR